jgi:hypothetical protein
MKVKDKGYSPSPGTEIDRDEGYSPSPESISISCNQNIPFFLSCSSNPRSQSPISTLFIDIFLSLVS